MYKLIDSLTLRVASGDGAPGSISFRREKYIPKGGPDGGDGGKGGDIVFLVNKSLASLSHLYARKEIRAQRGKNGMGRQRHGQAGEPTIIEIPPGTILKDSLGHVIREFSSHEKPFIFLKGGLGGKGNIHFTSSSNRSPRYAQKGLPGEEVDIQLEMKLIADIGLVGLPNAGKSTFIASITNARPKIANYPFTTLTPNLGIWNLDITTQLVIADIPGIIEGAHQGHGLGIEFLKHIERTSFLFFLIDVNEENPYKIFKKLNYELASFSSKMTQKQYGIGLSKIDACSKDRIENVKKSFPTRLQKKIIPFSSLSKAGIDVIRKHCYQIKTNQF